MSPTEPRHASRPVMKASTAHGDQAATLSTAEAQARHAETRKAAGPRLNVLLYGLNYEPELTGIGKYSGELARWLVSQGHHVQVVTAPPYYPEWRVHAGHRSDRYAMDNLTSGAGLRVLRCPLWVPTKVTGKTRILHLMSFALSSGPALLWMALKQRPSVIMLIVPTLVCAPAAILVGKLLRIPIWLHVQDFEIDAMHAMGIATTGGWARRLSLSIESWLMKRFDRVSSISPNMVKRLLQKGVQPERAREFPNWVDVSMIHPQPTGACDNPVRQELSLPDDALVVLYAGNMGQKQGIEVVLDAARKLTQHPRLHFVLAGAGAALEALKQQAQGLDNVQWLPLQPLERLNDLLNVADIHVLPQRADAADLVMPSKLTGMLASGRPVVGTADAGTQLGEVLGACGVRVPPGQPEALAQALCQLADSPEARTTLGAKGRQYALDHLSHVAVLSSFEGQLLQVLKATP